jgi:ABC-type polar amino acid transport system ATPase subunit
MVGLLTVKNLKKNQAEEISRNILEKVGLGDRTDYFPSSLSGGQRQRVSIARALALSPEILLLDEPTSALDPELTREVLRAIKALALEGNTMLLVTHETGFARDVADKVAFMEDGTIVEFGDTDQIFTRPTKLRTQQFLESAMGPLDYAI